MIDSFRGDYSFLSNFYIESDGKSVEHRYQAAKAVDQTERETILNAPTPGIAKRLGRACKMRPDWDGVRVEIMRELLVEKFSDPELAAKLVATYPQELVEGNYWHDYYWGVCNGKGENNLGLLLMQLRAETMLYGV